LTFNKREYDKKYHQEHREQIREYKKKYYQEHREQKREYNKKYHQEHREQIREYYKKWRQEHLEHKREYYRKWQQTRGYIFFRLTNWQRLGIKINSWQEYRSLYLQAQGKCEICKKLLRMTPIEKRNMPIACLDHDYSTGLPRGILCNACNRGVGSFEDRTNKYRTYVERKRRENENVAPLSMLWT
jgi:hypothetical protein